MATQSSYRWYILALVVLTNILVVAMPSMGMSVLAKEISQDLGLNLVQVGIVWGVASLPGIFTSLLGGVAGDRFGPKRVLVVSSLLTGLLGAARGLAHSFGALVCIVILLGALIPFVIMNGLKTAGQWFSGRQLAAANGVISMGMALGFLLGSLLSATTLSPLLGGWRHVLMTYGCTGALFSLPWFFTRPPSPAAGQTTIKRPAMTAAVTHVARLKNIWLLGFTLFGVSGCIQGVLGYLPLYLRGIGWATARADSTLAAFHTISLCFVLPFTLWSDRLGNRKRLLLVAGLILASGVGLLSVVSAGMVLVAVLTAGVVRDAFMAIFLTMVIETEGVGPTYAGSAAGLTMAIAGLGNVLAPPLGNSLAALRPGAPFAFWFGLAVLGMLCLSQVKQAGADTTSLIPSVSGGSATPR